MVDLNCWLSSNVWLSRIELDIRRECREVCCEADEWPGFKTSGGQCTLIFFFIFVLVFVCLFFSVVFVLAFVFIFGWVADWKRLEYESWNLTWDGMGFSLRMEVRWQDFKSICSTLRRRNREKSAPLQKRPSVNYSKDWATRVSTWMVPIIQPINHLLCFIPVGGITDGEVNQREMTPDSDSISVSIVQYSISRNLPQSHLPFVPYFITNIAIHYQTQGMMMVALEES